ncbi:MAG: S-layer homology domain-containing protein [Oscillospiraceae bacterium]|nr:S-layer homology domain-containing protein [Oscillospiraceae bacterium]
MNDKTVKIKKRSKIKFVKIISFLCVTSFLSTLFTVSADAGLISQNSANISSNQDYVAVSATVTSDGSVSTPASNNYEETPPLSQAMNVIRSNFELKKTAIVNSDITFKPEEFEKILGIKKLRYITITQLPDMKEGVLTLGGSEILEGQTISRDNIQYIRLVPYTDRVGTIKFCFKNTDDTTKDASIPCLIYVLHSLDFAPTANTVSVTTQKNIPVFKMMDGTDPENDSMTYKIIQAPIKGILEVQNNSNGMFVYRPNGNYTGSDKFIYQVEDQYGNLSNPATVQIKVTKAASNVVFTDMSDNWAYNSAVKAVADGFIDADAKNPNLKFDPSYQMTRAEFTKMLLRAAKLDKGIPEVFKTTFADDSDIPVQYKSYVEKAYELGIVNGVTLDTGTYFDPNSIITRAEAAVMVNNILKIPFASPLASPVFKDAVYIPSWAENDIDALNSCGIIKGDENGNFNPSGLLDKAQAVEMLSNMVDYSKNANKSGGLLSFLFGK